MVKKKYHFSEGLHTSRFSQSSFKTKSKWIIYKYIWITAEVSETNSPSIPFTVNFHVYHMLGQCSWLASGLPYSKVKSLGATSSNYQGEKKVQYGAQIQSVNIDSKHCEGFWSKHLKATWEKSKSSVDRILISFPVTKKQHITQRLLKEHSLFHWNAPWQLLHLRSSLIHSFKEFYTHLLQFCSVIT